MTLQELLIYPKFWIRNSYPYSDEYDALLNTLIRTEHQYEISIDNPYWIIFKKKNEDLTFQIWIANRFYGFLSHLEIYSGKAGRVKYSEIHPKRITAIRFWLKYKNLIFAKDTKLLNEKRKYLEDLTNYLEKDL